METPSLCFHCTSREQAEAIVRTGLKAGSYLFSDYDLTVEFASEWLAGEDWVVIAVETGTVALVPDQEFSAFGADGTLSWIAPQGAPAPAIRTDVLAALGGR